ncbi:hypothetical protein [Teredinibacter sp. KSP-S5-2]|uniref:hypothetical protein n=1 Tax=Teredinibacter sp. KSP-S5-2 TaxID=3034506 RepID=UPI002934CEBD|nr:hypothetical protein [Teredinibacter sp. KSP-S5-2]WNO08232.1 hypothetical protein P5V12_14770 [Teredinibacter sp. KSP-S5-2]
MKAFRWIAISVLLLLIVSCTGQRVYTADECKTKQRKADAEELGEGLAWLANAFHSFGGSSVSGSVNDTEKKKGVAILAAYGLGKSVYWLESEYGCANSKSARKSVKQFEEEMNRSGAKKIEIPEEDLNQYIKAT